MRVLGVCGGNGVILHPLKKWLIGNIEIRSNFKTQKDIQWKLNFDDIPLLTTGEGLADYYNVDVIVGAPNCGHSSMLSYSRAKHLSDPLQDESFDLYLLCIKYFKPKVFMMENLAKSLDMVSEQVWRDTYPDYDFIFHKASVSEWGNSQVNRKRLVIIGLRREAFGENLKTVQYHFNHIYKLNELKFSGELIKDCGGLSGHVTEDINEIITLYAGYKSSLKTIRDFWLDNPKLKRYPVFDRNFTTAPGVYRNLQFDYPATARKANRQFSHRGLQMSPRELARIQGVPDFFQIFIEESELIYWINKGRTTVTKTPPYEIGLWFKKQLRKSHKLWKS